MLTLDYAKVAALLGDWYHDVVFEGGVATKVMAKVGLIVLDTCSQMHCMSQT